MKKRSREKTEIEKKNVTLLFFLVFFLLWHRLLSENLHNLRKSAFVLFFSWGNEAGLMFLPPFTNKGSFKLLSRPPPSLCLLPLSLLFTQLWNFPVTWNGRGRGIPWKGRRGRPSTLAVALLLLLASSFSNTPSSVPTSASDRKRSQAIASVASQLDRTGDSNHSRLFLLFPTFFFPPFREKPLGPLLSVGDDPF